MRVALAICVAQHSMAQHVLGAAAAAAVRETFDVLL
jgi:hypothetical protein